MLVKCKRCGGTAAHASCVMQCTCVLSCRLHIRVLCGTHLSPLQADAEAGKAEADTEADKAEADAAADAGAQVHVAPRVQVERRQEALLAHHRSLLTRRWRARSLVHSITELNTQHH